MSGESKVYSENVGTYIPTYLLYILTMYSTTEYLHLADRDTRPLLLDPGSRARTPREEREERREDTERERER